MGVGGLIPLFVDLMGRLDLLTGNGNTKKNLYALCKGKQLLCLCRAKATAEQLALVSPALADHRILGPYCRNSTLNARIRCNLLYF